MQELDDKELLRRYVEQNSEKAFAELVTRHVHLVYSAALRKTGNASAAEEITQAVFIILAQKAGKLTDKTILPGWLYQTTRLSAATFLRGEIRRWRREQEAYMQSLSNENESEVWPDIAPLLEDAMGHLNEKDRNTIVLRFFHGKSFAEVGRAFGTSENAAKKRVAYALEKLQKYLSKHGVASTSAIIAGVVSANSIQAAPSSLAVSISAAATAKGAAATGSTLTLLKGAIKIMAWTKMQTAAVVGVSAILAIATTTVIVKGGDSSELIKRGWELLQAGRRDEATEAFNKAVERDPANSEGWNGLGWASLNSGRQEEAERDFQKVISLNPDHPAALNGLGQLYLSQKKYEEAETYLLQAAPQASAAWFGLTRLYLIQGKFEQAEEWAQKVVDSGQGDAIAEQMLQAAKEKQVSKKLRTKIEPK